MGFVEKRSRDSRNQRESPKNKIKKKKKTGWDDRVGQDYDAFVDRSKPENKDNGKTHDDMEKEMYEKQLHAANIAAMMQTKASLSQLCRIYVGSLDYTLDVTDLKLVFAAFGTIVNIDMPREGTRSKGFCFVEYTSPEAADMALSSMQGFTLKGRSIKVGRPTALSGQTIGNQTVMQSLMNAKGAPVGGDDLSAAQAGVLAAASLMASRPIPAAVEVPPEQMASIMTGQSAVTPQTIAQQQEAIAAQFQRIYVGNIPAMMSMEDLKNIFHVFGTILTTQLIASPESTQLHRGYGFIEFSTPEQAKVAIETMNGYQISGKQLKINYATPLRNNPALMAIVNAGKLNNQQAITEALGGTVEMAQAANMPVTDDNQDNDSSNIIILTNLLTTAEVDEEFSIEVKEECKKFGDVLDLTVQILGADDVRVFVIFSNSDEAKSAVLGLHGRWFAGRRIVSKQYSVKAYTTGDFLL